MPCSCSRQIPVCPVGGARTCVGNCLQIVVIQHTHRRCLFLSSQYSTLSSQNDSLSLLLVACSRLRDSGKKSSSKKKMRKTRGGWRETGRPFFSPPPPPFPSRARLIFALLVLIRPPHTIWEPGTGYATCCSTFYCQSRGFQLRFQFQSSGLSGSHV